MDAISHRMSNAEVTEALHDQASYESSEMAAISHRMSNANITYALYDQTSYVRRKRLQASQQSHDQTACKLIAATGSQWSRCWTDHLVPFQNETLLVKWAGA